MTGPVQAVDPDHRNSWFKHADRITVLRLGETVGTRLVLDVELDEIVGMITGLVPSDRSRVNAS